MLDQSKIITFKLGTEVVSHPSGRFKNKFLASFVAQTAGSIHQGRHAILTASGAVRSGRPILKKVGWELNKEYELVDKAWASSVGQAKLFCKLESLFKRQGIECCGQVLIHNDFFMNGGNKPRENFLALVNRTFMFKNTILILNQNDPLTNQENEPCSKENPDEVSDNDGTNCLVSMAVAAPLSISVSSFCLHMEDPRRNKNARPIDLINFAGRDNNPIALGINTKGVSCGGTGGMDIKLDRSRQNVQAGVCGERVNYILSPKDVLEGGVERAIAGERVGTRIICERPVGVSIENCPGRKFGCTKAFV